MNDAQIRALLDTRTAEHFFTPAYVDSGDDGDRYSSRRVLADDAPAWLRDLDDHIGVQCDGDHDVLTDRLEDALSAIERAIDGDFDIVDGDGEYEADTHNSDLLAWVGAHISHPGYIDEEIGELGADAGGFYKLIQLGQDRQYREVYQAVVAFLRAAEADEYGVEDVEEEW